MACNYTKSRNGSGIMTKKEFGLTLDSVEELLLTQSAETILEAFVMLKIGRGNFEKDLRTYMSDTVNEQWDRILTIQERNLVNAGKTAEKSNGYFYQFLLKNWCNYKHQGKEEDNTQHEIDIEIKRRIAKTIKVKTDDDAASSMFETLKQMEDKAKETADSDE